MIEAIEYDDWGNVLSDTNPGFLPFGFAGGLYDADTELIRFGARDYSANIARWTAKDPILFNGDSTSLYGFVESDPVNFSDPLGMLKFKFGGSATAIAGGAGGTASSTTSIDHTGRICSQTTSCLKLGAGVEASAGPSFSIGTGTLCEGWSETVGVYGKFGGGIVAGGSISTNAETGDTNIKFDLGGGAAASGGAQACTTYTECLW